MVNLTLFVDKSWITLLINSKIVLIISGYRSNRLCFIFDPLTGILVKLGYLLTVIVSKLFCRYDPYGVPVGQGIRSNH